MRTIVIVLVAFFCSSLLFAASPNFLHNVTPISDFTKEDSELFWNSVIDALDNKKDGEKLAWQNEKTGNSGLVNPLNTYQEDDSQCRDLRILNRSKKNIAESKYKFCKHDGKWVAINIIQ